MTDLPTTNLGASTDTPSVLFVCVKNGGKSQMAAGLMTKRAGDAVRVASAGTRPGSAVNALSAESLAEVGVDISANTPKPVTEELVAAADDADRALESWAVADALATLRPDHRRVIIETYYRGCSVAEAAATLGIPSGTVKSRTFYALKALKLALEERGLAP